MFSKSAQPTGPRPSAISRCPVTNSLIALNVAVFVLQNLVDQWRLFPIYPDFALSVAGLRHGCLWQLATYQFLHLPLIYGGAFHLLGNLFMIYVFGRAMEQTVGSARFTALYLLAGTFGGLLQMIGATLSPEHFGSAVVGASAGALGLVAAFATLFPLRMLHLFFLPGAVRADWFLAFGITVTLVGLFLPSGQVAHCAHLGGIFTGFLFARWFARRNLETTAPATANCPLKTNPISD